MKKAADNGHCDNLNTVFSLPEAPRALAGSDQQAVFVIGAPRSGTSLLYKILCLHPQASWISNYLRRVPQVPAINALGRLATARPAARMSAWFGDGQAYRYSTQRDLSEWAFPSPVEGEPFFRTCGLTADGSNSGVPRAEQKRRLITNIRAACAAQGGDVFVSKRIAHNQRIGLLAEALPNARFIHLVRDGRSVAKSLRAVAWWPNSYLPWYGGTPTEWEAEGRDPWEVAARHWVHELSDIAHGLDGLDPGRIIELRYEDLLATPESSLERLAKFAGLAVTEDMAQVGSTLRPSKGSGLDPSTHALVEGFQRETLERFGYECGT